jgi:hypothetical protein
VKVMAIAPPRDREPERADQPAVVRLEERPLRLLALQV